MTNMAGNPQESMMDMLRNAGYAPERNRPKEQEELLAVSKMPHEYQQIIRETARMNGVTIEALVEMMLAYAMHNMPDVAKKEDEPKPFRTRITEPFARKVKAFAEARGENIVSTCVRQALMFVIDEARKPLGGSSQKLGSSHRLL